MKKLLMVLILTVSLFTLVGCGGGSSSDESSSETITEVESTESEISSDSSTSSQSQDNLTVGSTFQSGTTDITLDKVVVGAGDGNMYIPTDGEEYLTAYWTIKNNSSEDYMVDVMVDGYVDGQTIDQEYLSGYVDVEPISVGQTLIGNSQTQGTTSFMVPTTFQEVKFRVTDNGNSATYTVTPSEVTAQ